MKIETELDKRFSEIPVSTPFKFLEPYASDFSYYMKTEKCHNKENDPCNAVDLVTGKLVNFGDDGRVIVLRGKFMEE